MRDKSGRFVKGYSGNAGGYLIIGKSKWES